MTDVRMRGVIILIVLLSSVAAPVAMASDGCSGMGTLCGERCSAPCAATPMSASDPVLVLVASLTPVVGARILAAALQTPDAPPKSLLSE